MNPAPCFSRISNRDSAMAFSIGAGTGIQKPHFALVYAYTEITKGMHMDMKLEVVVVPVSDVERSAAFYTKLGWRKDADLKGDDGFRLLQFTPPGSAASVFI